MDGDGSRLEDGVDDSRLLAGRNCDRLLYEIVVDARLPLLSLRTDAWKPWLLLLESRDSFSSFSFALCRPSDILSLNDLAGVLEAYERLDPFVAILEQRLETAGMGGF